MSQLLEGRYFSQLSVVEHLNLSDGYNKNVRKERAQKKAAEIFFRSLLAFDNYVIFGRRGRLHSNYIFAFTLSISSLSLAMMLLLASLRVAGLIPMSR